MAIDMYPARFYCARVCECVGDALPQQGPPTCSGQGVRRFVRKAMTKEGGHRGAPGGTRTADTQMDVRVTWTGSPVCGK